MSCHILSYLGEDLNQIDAEGLADRAHGACTIKVGMGYVCSNVICLGRVPVSCIKIQQSVKMRNQWLC